MQRHSLTWTRWIASLTVASVLVSPVSAQTRTREPLAQDFGPVADAVQDFSPGVSAALVAQDFGPAAEPQSPAPAPADSGGQKPPDQPAAVGEGGVKPTRGFVSSLIQNLGDDVKHIPRWNSLAWLVGGGAMAAAVHQRDLNINGHLIGTADALWKPGAFIGTTPTLLSAATATYVVGRARHSSHVQHLGMDEIEAVLLADVIVTGIKQSVRRDRPLTPDGQHQSGFSFPSGHATVTFAAATVLQQHLGYRAGVPTYLAASYVAMSRLHDNRHFASDVTFGAALGIIIGRSVTWHGRHFYGSPMLLPDGAGVLIAMGPQAR